jgi:hypothetical protein
MVPDVNDNVCNITVEHEEGWEQLRQLQRQDGTLRPIIDKLEMG